MDIDISRMYRFAMGFTICLCVGSILGLIAHYGFGLFSARAANVLAVGVGFWLLMFFGYRSDLKERMERDRLLSERRDSH